MPRIFKSHISPFFHPYGSNGDANDKRDNSFESPPHTARDFFLGNLYPPSPPVPIKKTWYQRTSDVLTNIIKTTQNIRPSWPTWLTPPLSITPKEAVIVATFLGLLKIYSVLCDFSLYNNTMAILGSSSEDYFKGLCLMVFFKFLLPLIPDDAANNPLRQCQRMILSAFLMPHHALQSYQGFSLQYLTHAVFILGHSAFLFGCSNDKQFQDFYPYLLTLQGFHFLIKISPNQISYSTFSIYVLLAAAPIALTPENMPPLPPSIARYLPFFPQQPAQLEEAAPLENNPPLENWIAALLSWRNIALASALGYTVVFLQSFSMISLVSFCILFLFLLKTNNTLRLNVGASIEQGFNSLQLGWLLTLMLRALGAAPAANA